MSQVFCQMPSGICFNEVPKPNTTPQRGTRPDAGPDPDFRHHRQGGRLGWRNIAKDVVQIQQRSTTCCRNWPAPIRS